MKKILIVDDHSIVRQGLIRTLKDVITEELSFGEAVDGEKAITAIKLDAYDMVLLDISLPNQCGLEVLKIVRLLQPGLPVVMLSSHPEEQYAIRCLRAGAYGYINKGSSVEVIQETIEWILAGRKYISLSQAELLVGIVCDKNESKSLHEALSDREYQLACMMTNGKTLTAIAKELSISVKTASTYRTRVLEKLNLTTNAGIINYCIQNNLS